MADKVYRVFVTYPNGAEEVLYNRGKTEFYSTIPGAKIAIRWHKKYRRADGTTYRIQEADLNWTDVG